MAKTPLSALYSNWKGGRCLTIIGTEGLALAGVSGVLAYSITSRTSEIGVRLALEAEHRDAVRSVVAHGMRPVLVGAALGLAVAIGLSRLMSNMLFEVRPRDPMTYGARRRHARRRAGVLSARAACCVDPASAPRVA